MSTFDLILIGVLIAFTAYGFVQGFIKTLGGIVGLIVGFIVAGIILGFLQVQYDILAQPVVSTIAFLVISLILSKIISWLFGILEGLKNMAKIIPFVGLTNQILGGVLGLLEAALLVMGAGFVMTRVLPDGPIKDYAFESEVLDFFEFGYGIIGAIIPKLF